MEDPVHHAQGPPHGRSNGCGSAGGSERLRYREIAAKGCTPPTSWEVLSLVATSMATSVRRFPIVSHPFASYQRNSIRCIVVGLLLIAFARAFLPWTARNRQ